MTAYAPEAYFGTGASSSSSKMHSNHNSAAEDSAIDAYATRVIRQHCPQEYWDACGDVGPYITSLLRCAEVSSASHVTQLGEYESLIELLEDQCTMARDNAEETLTCIADAICKGQVPPEADDHQQEPAFLSSSWSPASTFDLNMLKSALPPKSRDLESSTALNKNIETTTAPSSLLDQASSSTTTPSNQLNTSGFGPSPLKPDNLIPFDLLGVLDDPAPAQDGILEQQQQEQQLNPYINVNSSSFPGLVSQNTSASSSPPMESQEESTESHALVEAFPPLGAAAAATSTSKTTTTTNGASKKARGGKKPPKNSQADKDLAASLFRPARPRQNSIVSSEGDNDSNSASHLRSSSSQLQFNESNSTATFTHQQWESAVEILLSMNVDLSEEAAQDAARLANADFNVAQYIVDAAVSAPPVCRHMLHDGCYRSDCQFSHDVEGHTCAFWLRGRCGKGPSCKFLHGFHEKLLQGIPVMTTTNSQPQIPPMMMVPAPPSSGNSSSTWGTNNPSAAPTAPFQSGSWTPEPSPFLTGGMAATQQDGGNNNNNSFARIALTGYDKNKFVASDTNYHRPPSSASSLLNNPPTVKIPQFLWNPHENRDSSAFYISDPLERYAQVSSTQPRDDVIDLHFQSTKTFPTVLETILPEKLQQFHEIWIVTGTGHHVGSSTHQKGGGALEQAVFGWLHEQGYHFYRGKDRNGLGGAILVKG